MTTNHCERKFAFLALVVFQFVSICDFAMHAQTIGERTLTPGTSDWFDLTAWDNGVPNGAGDEARLIKHFSDDSALELSNMVILERLTIEGRGALALEGPGPLFFRSDGEGIPQIVLISASPSETNFTTPLFLDSSQATQIFTTPRATANLSGGISSTDGDLKVLMGTLRLTAGNAGWNGKLEIAQGELRLEHTEALLNSTKLIARPDSTITLVEENESVQDSRDPYMVPNLLLDHATLRSSLGNVAFGVDSTSLAANVELIGQNFIQAPTHDRLTLSGEITGSGGVTFQQQVDRSSSGGLVEEPFIRIVGATSYSGETVIGPDVNVEFILADALGDTASGTTVLSNSRLFLKGGGGAEQISVQQGLLDLGGAVDPYSHNVFLDSGTLNGGDRDNSAVLNTPVQYIDGAVLGSASSSNGLTVAGDVSGSGSLEIQSAVELQGQLATRGNMYIRGLARAVLSGTLDLAGEVFVDLGSLRLEGDLNAPDTSVRVASTFETASAFLQVASSNTVSRVVLDPRAANRESTFFRSSITTLDDAVLTITDDLRFMGGTISGAIQGQSVLTKQERTDGVLEDIAGSGFERVDVEGGELVVRGDSGLSPPAIHLGSHDTARLLLEDTGVYRADIYLNNAQGYNGEAALRILGNTTLAGNIFLGETGAILSGGGFNDDASLGPEARIHGGDLIAIGTSPSLIIRGGDHTYTGATKVLTGNLVLLDEGRLNSTRAVIGTSRLNTSIGNGILLDNSGSVAHNDRIPDDTPVHLEGVHFTLKGRDATAVTETLGTVHATRGRSGLVVENPDAGSGSTELRIQTLIRESGGTVDFQINNSAAKIFLNQQPALNDGLIGGWATFDGDEFATYGPNGVVAYSDLYAYQSSITSAASTDNVFFNGGSQSLTADQSINALRIFGGEVDLEGNQLVVESGGLLSRVFATGGTINGPGTLTAGTEAGGELITTGNMSIGASITDNAQGEVGLTHQRGDLRLSGTNTYTGPTRLNSGPGRVRVESETALPLGTDLILTGGTLYFELDASPTSPIFLGHVEVREGTFSSSTTAPPQVQPESILIESGSVFDFDIVGDAPITKRGPLDADFSSSLAQYSGPITIEGGRLVVDALGSAPLDDDHAVSIHRGGSLLTAAVAERKFNLDGGVIEFASRDTFAGIVNVSTAGGTLRSGFTRESPTMDIVVTGPGDLVVEGAFGDGTLELDTDLSNYHGELLLTGGAIQVQQSNRDYDGHVQVANENLTASGVHPLGAGQLTVLPEGKLTVGNPLTANVRLAGGLLNMQLSDSLTSPSLQGTLAFAEESYVFVMPGFNNADNRPIILSDVTLESRSNLTFTEAPGGFSQLQERLFEHQINFLSNVVVNESATLTSYDSAIHLAGTLIPGTENAILNLVGNDSFDLNASIDLSNGHTLTILEDGEPAHLTLAAPSKTLSGHGVLNSNVTLDLGGRVSPGSEVGALTIGGDFTLGLGVSYDWQIAGGSGTPGEDWDLLRIGGDLIFAENAVWFLRISDVPGLRLGWGQPRIIAVADQIVGFDPANVRIDLAGIRNAFPGLTSDRVSVFTDGGNLLVSIIPEPSAALLVLVGLSVLLTKRQSRA